MHYFYERFTNSGHLTQNVELCLGNLNVAYKTFYSRCGFIGNKETISVNISVNHPFADFCHIGSGVCTINSQIFCDITYKCFSWVGRCTSPEYLPRKYPPVDILDRSKLSTTWFHLNEWV